MAQASHLRLLIATALLNWLQAGKSAEAISSVAESTIARLARLATVAERRQKYSRLTPFTSSATQPFGYWAFPPSPLVRAARNPCAVATRLSCDAKAQALWTPRLSCDAKYRAREFAPAAPKRPVFDPKVDAPQGRTLDSPDAL
jgi:hypothetical protein